jgi:hypothetical protein
MDDLVHLIGQRANTPITGYYAQFQDVMRAGA